MNKTLVSGSNVDLGHSIPWVKLVPNENVIHHLVLIRRLTN
jgi:hypothetical protein